MSETVSTQKETVIANKYSGDYRIDVLLPSETARWNNGSPVGTATTVTFSFMNQAPEYASEGDKKGFSTFTEEQKVATRTILKNISDQFGLTFSEVTETSKAYGVIRFGNNSQGATSAGYASYPDTKDTDAAGDIYINNDNPLNLTGITLGTDAYSTIIHELGHSLGLKHPGNYNAGEPPSTSIDNFLAASEDSEANTIMSYIKAPQRQERDSFGKYDYLALKYLYGSKAYHAADDTYAYIDLHGQLLNIINDTGGTDTIDFSAVTNAITFDMRPGATSSVGSLSDGTAALNNFSLTYDTNLENLLASGVNDVITGNALNNSIAGAGGNDAIDGGAGMDTALFFGKLADYQLKKAGAGYSVAAKTGTDGTDTLTNIETLKFSDMSVNLGIQALAHDAPAANVTRLMELYVAFFNRVPDADGLAYWIGQMNAGQKINAIAESFYNAGVQFSSVTGFSANMTNQAFVNVIYKNVLGRADGGDAEGVAYWSGKLADGSATHGSLASTMLDSAHGFKGNTSSGFAWVADLLDNKITLAKTIAVDWGISYNSAEASISNGVAIAAAVTATDINAALKLIGISAGDVMLG